MKNYVNMKLEIKFLKKKLIIKNLNQYQEQVFKGIKLI